MRYIIRIDGPNVVLSGIATRITVRSASKAWNPAIARNIPEKGWPTTLWAKQGEFIAKIGAPCGGQNPQENLLFSFAGTFFPLTFAAPEGVLRTNF